MSPIERFFERAPWARGQQEELVVRALEQGLERAVRENPDTSADLAVFAAYVAGHLNPALPALEQLAGMHFGDLYLAWALGSGDRRALARFERDYLARLPGQVKSSLMPAPGELEQAVLTRLLVVAEGEEPRIRTYSGRGPLGAWVRMIATRAALDLRRSDARRAPLPDLADVPTDPELDFLKQRYAQEFSQALEAALASLPHRGATLLKLTFVDGLSASAIGKMYGVSGRTVQRWVADVREEVLTRTSDALKSRLSLTGRELESLLGLMQSRLHVSLARVLSRADGGGQTGP